MNVRTPLACTPLFYACSESVKNELRGEFTQGFHTESVRSATEACVKKTAGESPFDSATTEKICHCVGEETVNKTSLEETASLLGGSSTMSDELKERIKDVSIACTEEVLGMTENRTK